MTLGEIEKKRKNPDPTAYSHPDISSEVSLSPLPHMRHRPQFKGPCSVSAVNAYSFLLLYL